MSDPQTGPDATTTTPIALNEGGSEAQARIEALEASVRRLHALLNKEGEEREALEAELAAVKADRGLKQMRALNMGLLSA